MLRRPNFRQFVLDGVFSVFDLLVGGLAFNKLPL